MVLKNIPILIGRAILQMSDEMGSVVSEGADFILRVPGRVRRFVLP